MTFLGWMHRKFTHNSMEQPKNSIIGIPSACFSVQTLFDEQNYYVEQTRNLSCSKTNFQKSSIRFGSNEVEGLFQEEMNEPFEFLAIGTFGMELQSAEAPTPTLPAPSEDLTDYQIGITENDIELINHELGKFLENEENKLADGTSGRSSHASIITLSNKPNEEEDSDGQTNFTAFPLQNYLLANSIEVAETNSEVRKDKASLEELFKRNITAHDDPNRGFKGAKQYASKTNVTCFMKNMVKKFYPSSRSGTTTSKNEATLPLSMKRKISKVLKRLKKKVHPEEMTNKHIPHKDVHKIKVDDGNKIVGPAASEKSGNNTKKLSSDDICKCSSKVNGGRWIKTDSDYLVLEL